MYHREITNRAIEREQQRLDAYNNQHKIERLVLERHSMRQVESAKAHLADVWDPNREVQTRDLRYDEIRWVQNERLLCRLDFEYFSTRYATIRNWEGQAQLFKANIAQRMIQDIWADMEERGVAIAQMSLKARQLGNSTLVEIAAGHRAFFQPFTIALIASSDPDKSKLMVGMLERAYDYMPWWLRPTITSRISGEVIRFGGMDSLVTIQHGTQESGLGRGNTPNVAHLSEVCDFEDPEELIEASLLRAMHDSPNLFLVLESTAKGRHNYWHRKWQEAKSGYIHGRSRLCPVFLPWFIGTDIYPTETWLRARRMPADWTPDGETAAHAEKARNYVRSNELLRKYLGANWEMPKHQMFFWEVTRAEYRDNPAIFYSELAADDTEAFQSRQTSAFTPEVLTRYQERLKNAPAAIYGITGPGVPLEVQPDRREIDRSMQPVDVGDGFTLVPLLWSGYTNTDPQAKLFVYHMPQDGQEYGVGIDTSDGVGQDDACINVVGRGNWVTTLDFLAAEFVSNRVGASDLAPIAYAILRFFRTRIDGDLRQPRAVVECEGNGQACQLELRKMGWGHFHMRIESLANKKIDMSRGSKLGWITNSWSRATMLDSVIKAFRDDIVSISSPWFVDQMADLTRDEHQQKLKAAYGSKDDRIMAFGIAWYSLHALELSGPIRTQIARRRESEQAPLSFPRWAPSPQEMDIKPERDSPMDIHLDDAVMALQTETNYWEETYG